MASKQIEEEVRNTCGSYGITDEDLIREQIDGALEEHLEEALKTARESEEFKEQEQKAYEEAHDKVAETVEEEWDKTAKRYHLNDADFVPSKVRIYEHFYREEAEDLDNDGQKDALVRLFLSDSPIDQASFHEGRMPENDREIAIDRMPADNVGIVIGAVITVGKEQFKVVGLLSYVNYLTLHAFNTDLMFDAFGFDVAMVTPEGFDRLSSRIHYSYAWKYEKAPADKIETADLSENFLKALITQSVVYENEIEDYLPEYLRQATNFAPSDIEGDSTGTSILCYILIGVIAFIFAIIISNTIDKEASVIGTLRASGYSKKELIVHYMSMPVLVTIIGAIIGNVLGYTAFRSIAVDLYYESYSLPACQLVWSNTALIKTTVIPLLLMFFINLWVIVNKLRLTPLRFLRHDLTRSRRSVARRLPRWSFLKRFRLRILFQNIPNYLILIFGVIFIEVMMCFAFGLPDSLDHYAKKAPEMMFAPYQYLLMDYEDEDGKYIVTKEASAEKFSMTNLLYSKKRSSFRTGMGSGGDESVSVYGIVEDSAYISLNGGGTADSVYISSAFAKKFDLKEQDTITLKEEYEDCSYDFTVAGIVDYDGGIALFLGNDSFVSLFDKETDSYSGYFSEKEITDIPEKEIATVITKEDILKVTNQLNHSIGGIVSIFRYALILLTAALIYLLAKIIIERNEHSISMVKILGFLNGEISSLYIIPTAIVVFIFTVISFFVGYYVMLWIFKIFMMQMDGYFAFYMLPSSTILSVIYVLIGYGIVSVIDIFRIRRIPLDVALKNME